MTLSLIRLLSLDKEHTSLSMLAVHVLQKTKCPNGGQAKHVTNAAARPRIRRQRQTQYIVRPENRAGIKVICFMTKGRSHVHNHTYLVRQLSSSPVDVEGEITRASPGVVALVGLDVGLTAENGGNRLELRAR
jgi:hypothetical protein